MSGTEFGGESAACFADDHEVVDNPCLNQLITVKWSRRWPAYFSILSMASRMSPSRTRSSLTAARPLPALGLERGDEGRAR